MTFESEGFLIVAIYIWLPPASYVVFSDNSGLKYIPPPQDNAICLHDSLKYKHCSLQSKLLYISVSAEATALFAFASFCKKKLVQPHESNTVSHIGHPLKILIKPTKTQ